MASPLGNFMDNGLQKKYVIFGLKLYVSFPPCSQALSHKYDSLVSSLLCGNKRRTISFFMLKLTENFSLIMSQQMISICMSFQSLCSTTSFLTLLTLPVTSLGLLMQTLAPWGSLMRNSHLLHYSWEQLHCTKRHRWEQFGLDSSANKNSGLIKSRSRDSFLW